MRLQHPYWARKKIKSLNAESDFHEITHLAFEVRYASPIFTHALFSIAFARQAAIPSIAKVLFQNGNGAIIKNPRKRNNDTLLFFGEFFKHGFNQSGLETVQQLNRIHAHFPITNEQNLYTLATLMCEPTRMSIFLTGKNIFNKKENRAVFLFWKKIGEYMQIQNITENENEMFQFYQEFERKNFAYSTEGKAIVEKLADEFAERWYPKRFKTLGRIVYFSLFDKHLLSAFGLQKPPFFISIPVRFYLWFYLMIWAPIMPDPKERSIVNMFNKDYSDYHISKVGPFATQQ